jgi:hypothetical protein
MDWSAGALSEGRADDGTRAASALGHVMSTSDYATLQSLRRNDSGPHRLESPELRHAT